jgi:hypothetical protein
MFDFTFFSVFAFYRRCRRRRNDFLYFSWRHLSTPPIYTTICRIQKRYVSAVFGCEGFLLFCHYTLYRINGADVILLWHIESNILFGIKRLLIVFSSSSSSLDGVVSVVYYISSRHDGDIFAMFWERRIYGSLCVEIKLVDSTSCFCYLILGFANRLNVCKK